LRAASLLFAAGLHGLEPRGDPLFKAPQDGLVLVAAVPAAAQDFFVAVAAAVMDADA
jgi:hypothetical protein